MKRMLFNATQAEELRVAIVDGQKLLDLDIETTGKEQRKSNIYKGVITRIEPSLEAAFVDYGAERHGFLPFKEVSRSYFSNPDADPGRVQIRDALKVGQQLIVQVDKDERGTKGAALTTFISLAGRYLVLMPNNPRGGGVSRRIEGEERNEVRDAIAQLDVPQGMSTIARTAGIGRSVEELQWDLSYLLQLWRAIDNAAAQQSGAFLIYQDASLVIRAIRDYFHQDIGELLIDTESIYEQAHQFMGHVMPQNVNRVKLYKDDVPLFSRFQIEHQIETAFSRQVALPSGGSVVIDHTEAMVAIDVNSARATRGSDIEETALRTNLEAADEIARQLRLRDLGGLVVIDFIDMDYGKNQREVELRLRDALRYDRARVQTGKISRFGMLELSRQRLQTSLGETSHIACPRCSGTGHIRSIESTALHVLRILQEEAMKENTAAIHAQVPVDVATYLLNEKRSEFHLIEQRLKVNCLLIPNIHLETPHYTLTRLRHDELNQNDITVPSYTLGEIPVDQVESPAQGQKPEVVRTEAAVQGVTPSQPAPARSQPVAEAGPSILQRIVGWFASPAEAPVKAAKSQTRNGRPARPRRDERSSRRRDGKDHRERRSGRKAKSESASSDQRESQRDSNRQRQQSSQSRRAPRREQVRQVTEERPDAVAKAAIERGAAGPRTDATRTDANGETRTGRRRRRRGRGGERRPDEAQTKATSQRAAQPESTAAGSLRTETPAAGSQPVETPAAESQHSKELQHEALQASPAQEENIKRESSDARVSHTDAAIASAAPLTDMAGTPGHTPPPETDHDVSRPAGAEPMPSESANQAWTRDEPDYTRQPVPERASESVRETTQSERHDATPNQVAPADAERTDTQKVEITTASSLDSNAEVAAESSRPAPSRATSSRAASSEAASTSSVESMQARASAEPFAATKQDGKTERHTTAESDALAQTEVSASGTPADTAMPAATSSSGWKMAPIKLPPDMELVETKADARPTAPEATAEPKARPPRRPARPKAEPPVVESLVQIETQREQKTDNADNRK